MYASGYLENKVFAADPVGLVCLLYEGAIDSLLQARACLQEGRIHERSEAISKAMRIVLELQSSLDEERGGEISRGLAQLYAYIQERLAETNAQQKIGPLEEALRLLSIVDEGWKAAAVEAVAAPPPEPLLSSDSPAAWTL